MFLTQIYSLYDYITSYNDAYDPNTYDLTIMNIKNNLKKLLL